MSAQKALSYSKKNSILLFKLLGNPKIPEKEAGCPRGRQRTQLGMERVVDTKNINLVGSNTREECETDLRGREEAARGQTIERARQAREKGIPTFAALLQNPEGEDLGQKTVDG